MEAKDSLKEWSSMNCVDQQRNHFKRCGKKIKLEVKPTVVKQEVDEKITELDTLDEFKKIEEFILSPSLENCSKELGAKDVKQEIERNALSNKLDEDVEEFIQEGKIEEDYYLDKSKKEIFSNTSDEEFITKPIKPSESFAEPVSSIKNNNSIGDIQLKTITHKKNIPRACIICEKTFSTQSSLNVHMNIHKETKPYNCEICGRAFAEKQHLTRHMRTHTGERPFKCSYCPAAFADIDTVNKHHSTHTNDRPHNCDICGLAFKLKGTLARHMRSHTGERPYKCSYCPKAFADIASMHKHHRAHTNERPYTCDICGKSFEKYDLKKHKVEVHNIIDTDSNINLKTYKCEICERLSINKSFLTRHMRTHTGERPYKCSYCSKAFTDNSTCRRHQRTHTKERRNTCDICTESFAEKNDLKTHKVEVHNMIGTNNNIDLKT